MTSNPVLQCIVTMAAAGMAGGMGWGIRGQYGHETGAMVAGLLVCLTLNLVLFSHFPTSQAARAVALGTIGIGIGGSMTYGQTVGLTHDKELVGNLAALKWGMLGLSIKGGLWIGFAGLFLGIGLGRKEYKLREFISVYLLGLGLCYLGIQLLNEPFEPQAKILPKIYFSDDWRWEPGASLKPRREVWGGLLFAFVGLLTYVRVLKLDLLAFRMALWGVIGGAVGFPLGQSFQSFHAWNAELFASGWISRIEPTINFWNFMETIFGTTMGAIIGLGLWLNRNLLQMPNPTKSEEAVSCSIHPSWEYVLVLAHITLLCLMEFTSFKIANLVYDFGLMLAFIPLVGTLAGKFWPYWVVYPITLVPIAGKTFRNLVIEHKQVSFDLGILLFLLIPVASFVIFSMLMNKHTRMEKQSGSQHFASVALGLNSTMYFVLNFAFFQFPWPWQTWTSRTPNAIVFLICWLGLLTLIGLTIKPKNGSGTWLRFLKA